MRGGGASALSPAVPWALLLKVLGDIPFPDYLSVQNGADLLSMPDKRLLKTAYLSSDIFLALDKIYQDIRRTTSYIPDGRGGLLLL
jgi:hypothetical protein